MTTQTSACFPSQMFTAHRANEWIETAKQTPPPKPLFDEFWLEGELAIMYGDTGAGKSILAVQMAERIARGRPVFDIDLGATSCPGSKFEKRKPQTVLYLDLELTAKQFEMRYAAEEDGGAERSLKRHFRFSEKLCRAEVDVGAEMPEGFGSVHEFLDHSIRRLVAETGAKILILDNITCLKRTYESTREVLPMMKTLDRLKRHLGLSVLVLAHAPKRDTRRPLVLSDLQGSKTLANFADSIFVVGQSKRAAGERYVKHIRARATELFYAGPHVPVFQIRKIGGNFLGFAFRQTATENELLRPTLNGEVDREEIAEMKRMSDEGMSIRAIAKKLETSKTRVHRLLQMWRPKTADDERATATGLEEYDRELQSAHFRPLWYDDEEMDELELRLLMIEGDVLYQARKRAQKIYEQTGVCPPLAKDGRYAALKRLLRKDDIDAILEDPGRFLDPEAAKLFDDDDATDGSDASCVTEDASGERASETSDREDGSAENGDDTHVTENDSEPALTPLYDEYDKLILVEEFQERSGKPWLYYKRNSRGVWERYKRDFGGCVISRCDGDERALRLIEKAMAGPLPPPPLEPYFRPPTTMGF